MRSNEWRSSVDILNPMEVQRTSPLTSGSAAICGIVKTTKLPAADDPDVTCTFGRL